MSVTTRSSPSQQRDLHLLPAVRRQVLLVGVSDVVGAGLAAVMSGESEIELRAADPTTAATTHADVVIVDVVAAASTGGSSRRAGSLVARAPRCWPSTPRPDPTWPAWRSPRAPTA